MTTKTELELKSALLSTGLVQPIESKATSKSIEILCRQIPGQDKVWLSVLRELLTAAETDPSIELHICRRYVLRSGNMVFGWHIGVSAKTAKALATFSVSITEIIALAKPSLVPEEEPQVQRLPPTRSAPSRQGQPLPPGRHPVGMSARPRPPGPEANVGREDLSQPVLHLESREFDPDTGKETEIMTMPLPHVTGLLNVPNAKGRGARPFNGR